MFSLYFSFHQNVAAQSYSFSSSLNSSIYFYLLLPVSVCTAAVPYITDIWVTAAHIAGAPIEPSEIICAEQMYVNISWNKCLCLSSDSNAHFICLRWALLSVHWRHCASNSLQGMTSSSFTLPLTRVHSGWLTQPAAAAGTENWYWLQGSGKGTPLFVCHLRKNRKVVHFIFNFFAYLVSFV